MKEITPKMVYDKLDMHCEFDESCKINPLFIAILGKERIDNILFQIIQDAWDMGDYNVHEIVDKLYKEING